MKKGTFLQSNWILGALAVTILAAVAIAASIGGGVSLEAGGVQMTLDLLAHDGAYLSFVTAG